MNNEALKKILNVWFVATVVFAFIAHTYFFQIHFQIAQNGFSVLETLGAQLFPENFVNDFPGGSRETTRASILTFLYLPMQYLTGLSGLILMMIMIGLEVSCVAAGSLVLWRVLVNKNNDILPNWGYLWLTTILLLSYLIKPDLANFSFPYFHGQFYGFADAIRLAAIAFALSRKWKWVALCLVIGFTIHPIKMLMSGVFILAIAAIDWRESITRASIFWGSLSALFCGGWAYLFLGLGRDLGVVDIPVQEFVAYSRVFQVHWYPNDFGLWSSDHVRALTPFMGLMLMSLLALSQSNWTRLRVHQFLAGLAALLLVAIFGFWVSVDHSSSVLIKLCLLRASTLMTLLAPFIILCAVVEMWRAHKWHWVAIYGVFLLEGFQTYVNDMAPGLAIAAVILSTLEQRKISWWLGVGTLVVAGISIAFWIHYPATKNPLALLFDQGLVVLAALVALVCLRVFPTLRLIAASLIFSYFGLQWGYETRYLSQSTKERAGHFMEMQLWANENSKPDALFMVDPCQVYGWRDFSLRSSIGTPREWYLTGWGYSGDYQVLQRGQAIGDALGLNMEQYLSKPQGKQLSFSSDVCRDAQAIFYHPEREGVTRVVKQFGVDYFVMLKDKADMAGYTGVPLIQNNDYVIYAAKDIVK